MKDLIRRDSLVTIIGLALLAAAFVFVVYLPSQKTERAVRAEIAQAERSIGDIPLHVAELESLNREIAQRVAYLESTRQLVPHDSDMHTILSQIASLADESGLTVTRLEPLAAVSYATYDVLPFRVSLSGRFQGVLSLLRGLEAPRRLFTTDDLALRQISKDGDVIEVDVNFSAYVKHADQENFAGLNASPSSGQVDNGSG